MSTGSEVRLRRARIIYVFAGKKETLAGIA
jgi:hypothetical protein